jgi:uridine phosphorylase
MKECEYPILEFDEISLPVVTAKKYLPPFAELKSDRCVITYFSDVIDKFERVFKMNQEFKIRTEGVRPRVFLMQYGPFKKPVYAVPMSVGAPEAARMIEAMVALGVKKFMVCGGAGAINDKEKKIKNKVLIPTCAVRDEGTSYHYLPAAREIELNPKVQEIIERVLTREEETYELVKTWTTDAIFRETADKVRVRHLEGCRVVEMECSCYYSVAKYYKNISLGQLLYAGDSVSTDTWDYAQWHDEYEKREKLFELATKCLLEL